MKDYPSLRRGALALALLSLSGTALAACPSQSPGNKAHKLYLLFPTGPVAFPSFGFSPASATNPAAPFSAADLPGFTGTTAALRAAITQTVEQDYCDLNVQVIDTTTLPPATFARRNTVAVTTGSDLAEGLFGLAQSTDTGDASAVDYAYVWAKTYQDWAGGPSGALNGANSTLQRWADSIGGTVSHEAGHNYGLAHTTEVRPGEDSYRAHLMPSGAELDANDRAGERHLSDTEFSILAANLGLSMQTLWGWDLINPNAGPAHSLELRVLHPSATAPVIDSAYAGCDSPWLAPSVSGPVGPAQVVRGGTYYPYLVQWSRPNPAWASGACAASSGAPGQVAGGGRFHIGAAFMATGFDPARVEPLLTHEVVLRDASGKAMTLNPRVHGLDAGSFDAAGNFNLTAFNPGRTPLRLDNVRVRELPRVMALEQMVGTGRMADFSGRDFAIWPGSERPIGGGVVQPSEPWTLPVGKVNKDRNVHQVINPDDCKGDRLFGSTDTQQCRPGVVVDLFPATAVYLTATSIDPAATYWDATHRTYVQGALSTRVYYQLSGRRLDLDGNGIDDYIDAHPLP